MCTQSQPGNGRADPGLSAITSERRQLINLAYRLLGSLAEAEDAVQETYARWYAMSQRQQEAIESRSAWLTKVASRICLDLLGSARARRGCYVGEWMMSNSSWMGAASDSRRASKPWGKWKARWGAVALVLVLAACGRDSDDEATADTTETTVATVVAAVPYGPDDSAEWCSDLSDAVLALAEVDDVDLPPEETVDRVDAVIAVARSGPALEIPEITTLSETVTGTPPTAQAWIDAVNQIYDYCMTQIG